MVGKSCPVLCVLDIEGDNVSVLEGVPEYISPGQVGTAVSAVMHVFCALSVCSHPLMSALALSLFFCYFVSAGILGSR